MNDTCKQVWYVTGLVEKNAYGGFAVGGGGRVSKWDWLQPLPLVALAPGT